RAWNEAFSQPTPSLRSLQLRYLNCQEPILPFAPLLEELTVYNCSIDLCGSLEQLKLLRIDSRAMEIRNLEVVSKSPNLVTLEMFYCYRFFHLPPRFPALQNLILRGSLETKVMENFSAPLLRCLSLSLGPEVDCGALAECRGIDFTKLTTLHLDCSVPEDVYPEHSVTWTIMGLKGVIEAATNVQVYYIRGIKALTLLLLYFEETLNSGIRTQNCTLKAKFYDKKISKLVESTLNIHTDSVEADIHRIREFAHLPLDDTLQTFIKRLAHYSEASPH
ncbi:5698_t:CDS:1, partial [Acaulospora colombiana]